MAENQPDKNKTTSGGPAKSAEDKNTNQVVSAPNTSTNKITGTKRSVPSSPSSPSISAPGSSNGHLVYVRRKLDSEHTKITGPPISKDENVIKEQNLVNSQNVQNVQKVENMEKGKEKEKSVENSMKGGEEEARTKSKSNPDWKDRFIRLQVFLRNLDQSNQEEYMRMLRSFSSVGRSKHAVELEKRAIHLLLEEGKELHRMKVLNVLGKSSQAGPAQLASPVQPQQ